MCRANETILKMSNPIFGEKISPLNLPRQAKNILWKCKYQSRFKNMNIWNAELSCSLDSWVLMHLSIIWHVINFTDNSQYICFV